MKYTKYTTEGINTKLYYQYYISLVRNRPVASEAVTCSWFTLSDDTAIRSMYCVLQYMCGFGCLCMDRGTLKFVIVPLFVFLCYNNLSC